MGEREQRAGKTASVRGGTVTTNTRSICLNAALAPVSVAGPLLRAALVCLPLQGVEVAFGYRGLLGAQGSAL
jgi:hypothetical protein